MFIEPRPDTSLKLRRSVRLLPLSDLLRSYGTKPCARNVSYKHLAALRPVQTGSQGRTTHYYPRTPGFVSPLALTAALIVWIVISLGVPAVLAQPSSSPKRVVVLYWYDKDYPWNVSFDQSFQAALHSTGSVPVEYYAEYLETNRFSGEKLSQVLHDYLRQKYADRKIDAVVATSDVSLDFLLRYR